MPKTGGQLIAESLDINEVKNVFCVPGESYLGALDALFDKKKSIKASKGILVLSIGVGKMKKKPMTKKKKKSV